MIEIVAVHRDVHHAGLDLGAAKLPDERRQFFRDNHAARRDADDGELRSVRVALDDFVRDALERALLALAQLRTMARREDLDDIGADVVARARVLVARIAEPDDQVVGRGAGARCVG